MRIRILFRIQFTTLMRIRTLIFYFDADPDVDTGHQNYSNPLFNGENVMPVQRI
jgi:hypothetical protein